MGCCRVVYNVWCKANHLGGCQADPAWRARPPCRLLVVQSHCIFDSARCAVSKLASHVFLRHILLRSGTPLSLYHPEIAFCSFWKTSCAAAGR